MIFRVQINYLEEPMDKIIKVPTNAKIKVMKEKDEYIITLEDYVDYKSRIDKAIEYIYKLQKDDDIEIWRENGYWAYILNILNGGDDNGNNR